ncbi:hypothetical protein Hanom_Chr14g01257291 [Helianthus anomalus]
MNTSTTANNYPNGEQKQTMTNLQPLVQVSPRIIIVAVAVPVSPPDQHSPKLGHLASSQTV